jgi:hypothetical protein
VSPLAARVEVQVDEDSFDGFDDNDTLLAEQRGMDDQRAGKSMYANPYKDPGLRDWWDMGWLFALEQESEGVCSCSRE